VTLFQWLGSVINMNFSMLVPNTVVGYESLRTAIYLDDAVSTINMLRGQADRLRLEAKQTEPETQVTIDDESSVRTDSANLEDSITRLTELYRRHDPYNEIDDTNLDKNQDRS
jgi:hypothetical protein